MVREERTAAAAAAVVAAPVSMDGDWVEIAKPGVEPAAVAAAAVAAARVAKVASRAVQAWR